MKDSITIETIVADYPLPDSDFREDLWALAYQARQKQADLEKKRLGDDAMAINNALYLVVSKYIPNEKVTEDKKAYLSQLVSAVKSAKYEFSEVCYYNDYASNVMQSFSNYLMGELLSLSNSNAEKHTASEADSETDVKTNIAVDTEESLEQKPDNDSSLNVDEMLRSPTRTILSWIKVSLTSAPIAFLYYLLPVIYFGSERPFKLWFIVPPYVMAYGLHVYLMSNDPKDAKGIELCILVLIYFGLLWLNLFA